MLTFWADIKNKSKNAIVEIEKSSVLDEISQYALDVVPIFGPLLVELYQNSTDTKKEKTAEILELLKNFDLMDEKFFEQEVRSLVDRKEEIMKGQIPLKEILDESSSILKKSSKPERKISRIKTNDDYSKDEGKFPTRNSPPQTLEFNIVNDVQDVSTKDQRWFEWSIYLDSDNKQVLDEIKEVIWHLHPTFAVQDIHRGEESRESGFRFHTEGWGTFLINVDILFKNGKKRKVSHNLSFSKNEKDRITSVVVEI